MSGEEGVSIHRMTPGDAEAVLAIYREGIATGDATFELEPPSWAEWDRGHLDACRLVARHGQRVVGWAALVPVSERCSDRGVAEVSIYVAEASRRCGCGRVLLTRLIEASEWHGLWTLQAKIFPENTASLSLHETCGFRRVGVRERLGLHLGRWRDVVLLERRSAVVGIQP